MKFWVEYLNDVGEREYVERDKSDRMYHEIPEFYSLTNTVIRIPVDAVQQTEHGVRIYYGDLGSWRLIPWERVIQVGRQSDANDDTAS
jgi:hypothetical protein